MFGRRKQAVEPVREPSIPAEELCRVMYPTPCKERWTSNVSGWKTCDSHKKR